MIPHPQGPHLYIMTPYQIPRPTSCHPSFRLNDKSKTSITKIFLMKCGKTSQNMCFQQERKKLLDPA